MKLVWFILSLLLLAIGSAGLILSVMSSDPFIFVISCCILFIALIIDQGNKFINGNYY